MTDSDRAAVYSAESQFRGLLNTPGVVVELAGSHVVIPDERKFGRVEDIQSYVDRVLEFVGHSIPATVRERKGHKLAHYQYSQKVIAIPDNVWALREVIVLHELAHHMSSAHGHGKEFRRSFVDLVEKVMGPEARFLLQHEYFVRGLTG